MSIRYLRLSPKVWAEIPGSNTATLVQLQAGGQKGLEYQIGASTGLAATMPIRGESGYLPGFILASNTDPNDEDVSYREFSITLGQAVYVLSLENDTSREDTEVRYTHNGTLPATTGWPDRENWLDDLAWDDLR